MLSGSSPRWVPRVALRPRSAISSLRNAAHFAHEHRIRPFPTPANEYFTNESRRRMQKYPKTRELKSQRTLDLQGTHNFRYDPLPPDPIALNLLEQGEADPMAVFAASVARGTVTVATAELCLKSLLSLRDQLQRDERQAVLHKRQSGTDVLH